MCTRGPRIQPVGARSRATGVARLKKVNTDPPVITKSGYRTRKDGFESCDAGRAGARPYRRKPASRRIDSQTFLPQILGMTNTLARNELVASAVA